MRFSDRSFLFQGGTENRLTLNGLAYAHSMSIKLNSCATDKKNIITVQNHIPLSFFGSYAWKHSTVNITVNPKRIIVLISSAILILIKI